jgi:DNA repair ATPase RecN
MTGAVLNATTTSSTDAPVGTLTKSQKKRMKRQKALARKEEEKRKETSTTIDALNPFEKLCNDVVSKLGYDRSLVNTALDEMWNKQLDYSDFDTVVNYLNERPTTSSTSVDNDSTVAAKVEIEADAAPAIVAVDSASDTASAVTEKEMTNNTMTEGSVSVSVSSVHVQEAVKSVPLPPAPAAEVPLPPQTQSQPQIVNNTPALVVPAPITTKHGNASSTISTQSSGTNSPAVQLKKKSRVKPIGLSAKLDIVASSEILMDGIIALSEWVNKAATTPEIQEFCSAKSTNPLQTVVKRTILSDTNATGQLLDLVGSILRAVGVPSSESFPTAKAFASLIKAARDMCNGNTSESHENIASGIAQHIVKKVAATVNQMMNLSSSSASATKTLQEEIQKLQMGMKKTTGTGSEIMDLMMRRDKSKNIAEKYVSIMEFAVGSRGRSASASASSEMNGNGVSELSALGESDIMASILGDEYKNVLESEAKYNDLKSRQAQTTSSSTERDTLVNSIDSFKAEKKQISTRMQELKKEMEQLTVQDAAINKKIKASEAQLTTMRGAMDEEEKEIETLLDSVSQAMELKNSVSTIAKQVGEVTGSLDSLIASRAASNEGISAEINETKEELPEEIMASILQYFESELNTIIFLKKRAEGIQEEVQVVRREIKECQALGMTSTVSDMKKQEKKRLQDVMDDLDLVEGCVEETKESRRAYGDRLYDCLLKGYTLTDGVKASVSATLTKINAVEAELGVDQDYCSRWFQLMTLFGNKSSPPTVESIVKQVNAPAPTPVAISKPLPKKTGWGSVAGNSGASTVKKSLMEIQKEEISSK